MLDSRFESSYEFSAKEIRDILKSKVYCLRAGFPPDNTIIETLNNIRDEYAQQVGLSSYLSQMLGPLATVEVQYCTLYNENGQRIEFHLNGNYKQSVQRCIRQHFRLNNLPFKVEARTSPRECRVDVRYL